MPLTEILLYSYDDVDFMLMQAKQNGLYSSFFTQLINLCEMKEDDVRHFRLCLEVQQQFISNTEMQA